MHKKIIPGLVSFETDLQRLSGCYISADFDAYPPTTQDVPFRYGVSIEHSMAFPDTYEFRHQHFFKSGGVWYYARDLAPGVALKFRYDRTRREFRFNEALRRLPFVIGGIVPAGGHLADIIALDLILAGCVIVRGCALAIADKAVCVIGPGFNGKTTFLGRALELGARYIADELLIINTEKNLVYPVSLAKNLGRRPNTALRNALLDSSMVVSVPMEIDRYFLIQNTTSKEAASSVNDKCLLDYLYMLSLFEFYDSPFVTAMVPEEGLTAALFERIDELRTCDLDCAFVRVREYDFGELLGLMGLASPRVRTRDG